jgi:hypothetical protein
MKIAICCVPRFCLIVTAHLFGSYQLSKLFVAQNLSNHLLLVLIPVHLPCILEILVSISRMHSLRHDIWRSAQILITLRNVLTSTDRRTTASHILPRVASRICSSLDQLTSHTLLRIQPNL